MKHLSHKEAEILAIKLLYTPPLKWQWDVDQGHYTLLSGGKTHCLSLPVGDGRYYWIEEPFDVADK